MEDCPYEYDKDSGEARFVSKDMYNALLATCRCGRKKTDTHIVRCLQKAEPGGVTQRDHEDSAKTGRDRGTKFPATSSGKWDFNTRDSASLT